MSSVARVALAVATSLTLAGCGSASEPSPPTGVDELVIPSPSLDPDDFVDDVDNPWLPLTPGTSWEYRGPEGAVVVTVLDETREVQGVTATVVLTEGLGQRPPETETDWFAQDVAGNVWHLGEDGAWEAGVDDAQAGLAMPAEPRVGDGYRREYAEDVAEDHAEVVSLDGSASVPYGDLTDLLELEVSTPLAPGAGTFESYARGIGLVRSVGEGGSDGQRALVAFEDASED